jgi:Cro/C1-type HTH DNA-binding domain
MNISQVHDRLRLELLRRIERGTVSISLLARQTGFGQSHLSNFLRNRRQLSLAAIDRILAAQHLSFADLLPASSVAVLETLPDESTEIPLVAHDTALFAPLVRPAAVQSVVHVPAEFLCSLRTRVTTARRAWQRLVAVRTPPADARAMDPLLLPGSITVLDRHYVSPRPYHLTRPTLFAMGVRAQLTFRYAEFLSSRLILRPHNTAFPLEVLELEAGDLPDRFIVGRVAFIFNPA